ncbi:rhomboid family intramembrane serine protease [Microbulbifer sp. GL-2]|uniref:rhomboid family intramembrane serine protease n=1 Tax=Microbulbifer sp. GL-2 TaxID=2591606 RepID=UPI00116203CD|nr:rhomboid family intramembrane serine protease [Microbulbifer sp. GL-2]BBM01667.1 rhomboid family intramembrane serine protease [Microbulbifer sp. GL-2]
MSQWIVVYAFPLSKDLSALVRFIQRYQLPLRIAEEKNRQQLLTPDASLAEILKPLLQRWDAGEIDLDKVQIQSTQPGDALETAAETIDSVAELAGQPDKNTSAEHKGRRASVLPSFPLDKTPISLLLIALCFLGWFLQTNNFSNALLIYPDQSGNTLAHSSLAWHLQSGEWWRLLTPAIVHFSLPHALFNALGIWILGRPLEARGGSFMYIALVLIGAAVSNLTQYLWEPRVLFGGMSGVVYALVGFALVVQRFQSAWRDIPSGLLTVAMAWLIVCALGIVTFFTGVGVANAAHIGGFFSGLVIALVYCVLGGGRKFSPG